MLPPWAVISPMRAAGNFMIRTVKLPGDDIRRSDAQAHIGHTRGRQGPDENGDGAGRQNRPAHVRNRRNARCDHWAHVHVCDPRLRLSHR